VVLQDDLETSEIVGLPSTGWLEAEALRVDHGHDRNLAITVWQVAAASAAIIGALYDQMVVVGDPFCMAGWLD
jgi:hypothetical protein